ncbi:MAG TPA: phosphoribosylanthranilate isomerase [Novimethylophilus sp.]|jgi:phosphoribosylanthranilate isomerase|uniref:phosphoribosylanthranilate isomerase n=1 Tax=Novimethylophilus sp. TaxID=2137426 RepID=UPI002F4282A4
MVTRAKICGITRVEDALAAVAHGANAIGLVFYEKSPRQVSMSRAAEIVASLPPFVAAVGLFVDAEMDLVHDVQQQVRLDFLQFHGDESPDYCQAFDFPYIKALRVRPGLNLLQYAADFASARALLLDAYQEGVAGGTGRTFDWDLIPAGLPKPVILAGGLNAANVGAAIRRVRPYAVDVSGGVEREKGIKDAAKIAAFMRGVLDAEV